MATPNWLSNRLGCCTGFTSSCVRRLLRFGHAKGGIAAMAKPHCCKEAQAAPLHERGPAAMSEKAFCLRKIYINISYLREKQNAMHSKKYK